MENTVYEQMLPICIACVQGTLVPPKLVLAEACVDSRQTLRRTLLSRDVKQHTALEGPGIATHIDMYIHACI